ncbi:MAG: hypothetical protein PHO67_07035 [Candidatus Omnitrophica bacterium]|nr:hypothetical protein [Candidatus Omnitrophota bacterium]
MELVVNIAITVCYIFLYLSSLIFVWNLIFKPERLDYDECGYGRGRITFAIIIGAGISLLLILYIGLDRAFFFIPESWTLGTNEDGEPNSVKGGLVGILSLVSAIYIMSAVIGHRLNNYRKKMTLEDNK